MLPGRACRRASRRQRGPSLPIRISSKRSHASLASVGRSETSLTSNACTHAAISGSTSSAMEASGGGSSLMCLSRIAIGASSSNGTRPAKSSKAMQPTE